MPPPLRMLDVTLRALLSITAIIFGLGMVYTSVFMPLTSGTPILLDHAVFACAVLLAAGSIAYYCKFQTSVAKWASYFMLLFSIWIHALVSLLMRLPGGGSIEADAYLRMGAGAMVLIIFGIRWAKSYRVQHS